ncbi:hypothetical protein BKG60_04130 [Mycobacterium syngnathidarum]|uniref:Membrane transport protein MMPL domain-containing protein n=2 Tax=Mycobacterium syngnathidarum TaxID=1908205 RepID=A0A1S1JMA2_9MYCO|nr:hypothetical protein BKG61_28110 [Mycobacterium syngnathidarum]OLT97861.1 hypothetical protein BKG60_04130 [Mycobacterium syngnathidarum]
MVLALILNMLAPNSFSVFLGCLPANLSALASHQHAVVSGPGTDNTVSLVLTRARAVSADDVLSYLDDVQQRLSREPGVTAVLNMSADPLTAPAAQSSDRRTAYLPIWLDGELGSVRGLQTLAAAQSAAAQVSTPSGVQLTWAGPAADAQAGHNEDRRIAGWLLLAVILGFAALALLAAAPVRKIVAAVLSGALALAVAVPLCALLFPGVAAAPAALVTALTIGTAFGGIQLLRNGVGRGGGQAGRGPYLVAALTLVGAAGAASATLIAFGLMAFPAGNALALWAGLSITVCAMVVMTVAPLTAGNGGRSSTIHLRAATAVLRLRTIAYRRANVTLAAGTILLAVAIAALLGSHPTTTDDLRVISSTSRDSASTKTRPITVVITGSRDLRNPVGLLAVDKITRQVSGIPGVRSVQSASWPGGQPWADATVAHQVGELNRHVQSGGLAASPVITSAAGLPDLISQMIASIDQLERSVDASANHLPTVTGSMDSVHASITGLTQTIGQLSRHAEPLRTWIASFPDCAADPLCALGEQIIEPVDAVIADTTRLRASSGEISDAASSSGGVISTSRVAIAQMRASLTQLGDLTKGLSTTATERLPQMTKMTAFLNLMTTDLSTGDAGGFYLSQEQINAKPYAHVRDTFFSSDGRSASFIVTGDAETHADIVAAIPAAVAAATKFGPLQESSVAVAGAGTQHAWAAGVWYSAGISALAAMVMSGLCLRSVRAGAWVATAAMLSAVTGLGLHVVLSAGLLDTAVSWPGCALGAGIGMAVVAFDAAGVAAHALARRRARGPTVAFHAGGTPLVGAAIVWTGVTGIATLIHQSALGQVGALVALIVTIGALLSRAWLLRSLASECAESRRAERVMLVNGQLSRQTPDDGKPIRRRPTLPSKGGEQCP